MKIGPRLAARVMACAFLLVLHCRLSFADGSAPDHPPFPAGPGAFDDPSSAYLEKVSEYIAGLDRLSFNATVRLKRVCCHPEVENDEYRFEFERPNRLCMSMKLPDETLRVRADGHKLELALESLKEYRIQDQPEDLGTLVGWLTQQPAFRRLFSKQLTAGWTENVRHAHVVRDRVDDTDCDRLDLFFDRTDLSIWFRAGDEPVPVTLLADLSASVNRPKGSVTTEIRWRDWHTGRESGPAVFAVSRPAGFTDIDAPGQGAASDRPDKVQEFLMGQQAPPFSLELLEGGTASLRDSLGKNTVVLEFWATWCRPCRQSLEDMEDQLPQLKKSHAVVYAVNLMEPREQVEAFARKTGTKLPVAFDPKGELAEQLHLEAVPTTVVIGPEGSIRSVHMGFDRGLARVIRNEVEALSQGQDLEQNHEPYSASRQLRYRLGLDSKDYCAVFVGY